MSACLSLYSTEMAAWLTASTDNDKQSKCKQCVNNAKGGSQKKGRINNWHGPRHNNLSSKETKAALHTTGSYYTWWHHQHLSVASWDEKRFFLWRWWMFYLCPHHWRSSSDQGSEFRWPRRWPYLSHGSGSSCACTAAETSQWKLFARSRWAHSSFSELKFSPGNETTTHRNSKKRESSDLGGQSLLYLLPCKLHLDIRINQVLIFPYECLLDVGHDAGVHPGEALGSVDLQIVARPLSLCRDAFWQEEVPGQRSVRQDKEQAVTVAAEQKFHSDHRRLKVTPRFHLHPFRSPCVESLWCLLWPRRRCHTWRSLYIRLRCRQGRTAKPTCGKTGDLEEQ